MENKGFSLLELLISAVILSVGILTILQALGLLARVTGISSDTLHAITLAEDKLQELQYKERSKQLTGIALSENKGKYGLVYNLEEVTDLPLYKCTFNIQWDRANRKEALVLNTYLRK